MKSRLSSQALQGGRDSDGSTIFVGRAMHNGIYLPAKIIPSKQACYVCECNRFTGARLLRNC